MTTYRFITEDDTAEFCNRVSQALDEGWALYGNPTYAFDHAKGVMRCGQAVVKETDDPV